MSKKLIPRLRLLQERAEFLNRRVVSDLQPFLHPFDKETFLRLPTSKLETLPGGSPNPSDIGVTVTCTALMTLCTTGTIGDLYSKDAATKTKSTIDIIDDVFQKLLAFRWASSKLLENNAFTSVMVLRTAGMVCHEGFGDSKILREKARTYADPAGSVIRFQNKSLSEIATWLLNTASQERLGVGDYPPTPAIVYWCVDAVDSLGIELDANSWADLAAWSSAQLRMQISLIEAEHQALMDPIALGMCACLCQRLRSIASMRASLQDRILPALPSVAEQLHGVEEFCKKQRESGIWEKYFPLFHYPGAGANHCWAFEVLEALMNEYPESVGSPVILRSVERAIRWCFKHRLKWCSANNTVFEGWNSGGQQETLVRGEPESWATGVVHMFLSRVQRATATTLSNRLLESYCRPHNRFSTPAGADRWKTLWESPKYDPDGSKNGSVHELIRAELVDPIITYEKDGKRGLPSGCRKSALLFGPPGTGKTTIVREFANVIGWNFIELNPSTFLNKGLENIYSRADEVFHDLNDVTRTVVFFDEMDALVQRRGGGDDSSLDVNRQFLTTSMLPKLAQLHDETDSVVFFMATNHIQGFDEAITRAGRFDLLLCVGPPDWSEKLKRIETLASSKLKGDMKKARELLESAVANDDSLLTEIELLTKGEFGAFLEDCAGSKPLQEALQNLKSPGIKAKLKQWTKDYMTLRKTIDKKDNKLRSEYEIDRKGSRSQ